MYTTQTQTQQVDREREEDACFVWLDKVQQNRIMNIAIRCDKDRATRYLFVTPSDVLSTTKNCKFKRRERVCVNGENHNL